LNNSGGGSKDFVVDSVKLQNSKNNEIRNNTIYNNGGNRFDNGVGIRNACTNTTIANNQIEAVKNTGIGIYFGSAATISENTINSAGKHGLTVFDKASVDIKQGNQIHASGEHGISVSGQSHISLEGSTITNSKSMGVNLVGATVGVLSNNTIQGNGRTGINISGGTTVQSIQNNHITNNTYKGIGILDATVAEIKNNSLSNPKAEWEITVSSSNTPVESMRVLEVNKVSANNTLIRGNVQGPDSVSAWIGDVEHKGNIVKREYSIAVPALIAGMEIKVTGGDKFRNVVYAVVNVP
jgi:parallel beta-helix repeat protein